MKEKLGQFKEFAGNLSSKTKKIIIAVAAGLVVAAVVIALILNNRPYAVLFTGLGEEEAREITAKLQEDGVAFRYEGDSTIMVQEKVVDQTKATLVQQGYPKSGFAYDTYIKNSGLMTTDSDKKTYELYDLQDRIGATIKLFDGVADAKVTIALGEDNRYVLNDSETKSSASVTVVMKDGGSPTKEQTAGIQRLVAKSVANMAMEDVAVLDGNGNTISETEDKTANSSDAEEIAAVVEGQIEKKILKVLGPIYGEDNVSVAARAKINMEQLIRESTTYNTPEKIDDEDKTGIISHEDTYNERSGSGNTAGGVVGTETNADTAEYNTEGDGNGASASSESRSTDYLVNQIKEQGQLDSGALDDLTVSVVVNGKGFGSLREAQLRSLVGNAAGIVRAEQADKITLASAPFDGRAEDDEDAESASSTLLESIPLWAIIAAVALLLILTGIIVVLIIRRRRAEEEEEEEILEEEVEHLDLNQELQQIQNDRGMELKRSIREFAEQNAEISAQLLKNWLNGGGLDGG
ncbi:MAG: flagellar M-ring protein FliF [Ruminococcus sp.]|uniref:Flagellar M-ring protein FliF n=1 Tax=Schaedlerella arabinosiphila TaxID=2044587 RepID=A0A426DLP1_9FIRM|nr:flagellar basal-body MS-ring/collar protein FliF [Schaedlerella arabinosiphila]MCI8723494.1 flagellar M-ring protein FliF [Ruminococcus sp.]RRK33689.1 flagellar M-ring protein FliF [Schaedlerella arabinosiphila]